MVTALERKAPEVGSQVPIWELEFHLWDTFCDGRLILGNEFQNLAQDQQDRALSANADIFIEVSEKLNFAGVTLPGAYWEVAPGHPAYFWLPAQAQVEQIRVMKKRSPDFMLITSNSGILAMPEADDFVEFSLELHDSLHEARREDVACLDLVVAVDDEEPFELRVFELDELAAEDVEGLEFLPEASEEFLGGVGKDDRFAGEMLVEVGDEKEAFEYRMPVGRGLPLAVGGGGFVFGL